VLLIICSFVGEGTAAFLPGLQRLRLALTQVIVVLLCGGKINGLGVADGLGQVLVALLLAHLDLARFEIRLGRSSAGRQPGRNHEAAHNHKAGKETEPLGQN
jgi:hypothetical protein